MTEQQFTYWLQGFAELNPEPPTKEQWQSIREHLGIVLKKVTPQMGAKVPDLKDSDSIQRMMEEATKKQGVAYPAPTYTLREQFAGRNILTC